MTDTVGTPEQTRHSSHWFRRGALAFRITLAVVISLATVGQLLRDRTAFLALLMYIPLPLLGSVSVIYDLILRGRSVPRVRFGMAIIGLILLVWGIIPMIGMSDATAAKSNLNAIHWNVQWGGFTKANWRSMIDDIIERQPDLILISEAPEFGWTQYLADAMGSGWHFQEIARQTGRYWFRFAVYARWPVSVAASHEVRNGTAVEIVIDSDPPMRVMMVDGKSDPFISRTPLLEDVRDICQRAADKGTSIDIIAGDFNAVSRSIGFDAFATMAGGYDLSSRFSREWRGTFPQPLPLYDIDHVWIHKRHGLARCNLFSNWKTDHRGQLVRIDLR